MSFNELAAFTQKVADAADQIVGNPVAAKALFDAAPEELRTYFNNLVDALKSTASGDSGAKNTGATAIQGLTGTDVQTLLESLKTYTDRQRTFVSAYQSTGQAVGANTWTKVLYQTEVTDVNNEFDPTTSKFTAAEKGTYALSASLMSAVSTLDAVQADLLVKVNGVDHIRLWGDTLKINKNTLMAGSTLLNLNAGDYVEIYFQVGGMGGSVNPNTAPGSLNTYLRIQRVG
jgi:hypothetical protein